MNIAMMLTWFRILLIPVVVVCYYLPLPHTHFIAMSLFAIASITDLLDGWLARSFNQGSKFGAFLDPVADKLMVTSVLIIVLGSVGSPYIAIPTAIIIGREITISALREWMAEMGKRTSMAVKNIGKIKTVIQMFALGPFLLYDPTANDLWIKVVGIIALYIAAILTLWSMIVYLKIAYSDLTLSQKKQ
ncbi:MAG: CDP-diacylglycerol--glycerol-3-phosphate 3-phosphatidyltransferase [Gammaproteobacteria bacterium]|nr:CDP-diacylglycerol--glycerol-3-phosphate 3-phosphatidyltransferase [Gammaproteobacteria bacterium]